jgi:FkbM family methyltransferase
VKNQADELVIPQVIHRVWLGDDPQPELFLRFETKWRALHPGWRVITWGDDDLRELGAAQEIASQPDVVVRADLARYHIIHDHGGLYVDADFEPLQNIEPLLRGHSLVLGEESSGMIAIGFFAATSGHPFLGHVLTDVPAALEGERARPANFVIGPAFFTRCYQRWSTTDEAHARVLPQDTLYPYLWLQANPGVFPPTTYAVHHWASSWEARPPVQGRLTPALRAMAKQAVVGSKRLSRRAWRRWSAIGREEPEAIPQLWGTGIGGGQVFVKTRHGFPLVALSSDRNITPALLAEGTYGREYIAALRTILGAQDVFVDVGASIGIYACAAAARLARGGRVFAFEPNPVLCDLLRTNVHMNRMLGRIGCEVAIHECAVSDSEARVELSFEENDPTQGTIVASRVDGRRRIDVETVTLDGLLSHLAEIQLLKIDAEGAELKVIRGALDLINSGRVRFLDLELEHRKLGPDWSDLIALLHSFELDLQAESYTIDAVGNLVPLPLNEAIQAEQLPHFVWRFPRHPSGANALLVR